MSSPGYFYSPEDQDALTQIQRRQAYARALLAQGQDDPGHAAYSGLRNAGNSILGAFLANRADKSESALAKSASSKYAQDLGAFLGGRSPAAQGSPQVSNEPGMSPQMPTAQSAFAATPDPMAGTGVSPASTMPQPSGQPQPQAMPPQGQPMGQPQMPGGGQNDLMQRLLATGNPNLINQFAPGLLQNQQMRDNEVFKNNLPLSVSDREQSDLQLQRSEALAKFNNGLPLTAHERASLNIQQGNLNETRRYHNQMAGMGADENGLPSPVVMSYVDNLHAGNMMMQNVPQPLRGAVSLQLAKSPNSYSPTAATKNTLASSRITAPYTNMAAYKLTADALPYLQRIDAAMKVPGSVSDQDMLDSLTKLNTGGNAVTDAQVKLITDGKSYSDWAGVLANKFKTGGVLSPDQRKQIKEIANNIFDNYRKGYQPVYEKASAQLEAANIPKQFWTIPDLNSLNSGQSIGSMGGGSSAPSAAGTSKILKYDASGKRIP